MKYDNFFLERAFKLAEYGRFTTSPNPNVGCVIVRNGNIIGEGYHQNAGGPHAEIYALRMAGNLSKGATIYITLEPCNHYGRTPPCTIAIVASGIIRAVIGMLDPNPHITGGGIFYLKKAGIEVRYNLMLKKAKSINCGFIKRMCTGYPYIKLKLAMSIDGRTAMKSGESKWITSKKSLENTQRLRAESDVILSTSSTILIDNPKLNVRWCELPSKIKKLYPQEKLRQPIRVIIDSKNRLMPYHNIIRELGDVWLIRLIQDKLSWPKKVSQIILPSLDIKDNQFINLTSLMKYFGEHHINNILIESGAQLAGALLNAKLIDELILYIAPKLLGFDAKPLFAISGLKQLNNVPNFTVIDMLSMGVDICLRLKPNFNQ